MSESREPVLDPMPGSLGMPPWEVGTLPDAPPWSLRNWTSMIGPGLLTAGAAIGGGEWLMGPVNTGRYGGGILWVTTVSILAQVLYNIEISRYTLYTGEPIMSGKFRTALLAPLGWFLIYMILDAGSLIPYQAAGSAVPLSALFKGSMPTPEEIKASPGFLIAVGCAIYVLSAVPLVFAGKIYSFIKGLMTFKVVVVFACLIFLTLFYVRPATWWEVFSGFVRFGNVPAAEGGLANIPASLFGGQGFPKVDAVAFPALAAYAAIAGIGGMKNTMISNYTREQGWGMGGQIGAIPSLIGGRNLELSHVGKVFRVSEESLPRWRRWMTHVTREQVAIWGVGAMIGVALPAMLAIEYLKGHPISDDRWQMAGFTAQGIKTAVGGGLGTFYWYMLMFCSVLILVPNTVSDTDSTVRRWVDLAWTASARLRTWSPKSIKQLYFWGMVAYVIAGLLIMTLLPEPKKLIAVYGCIANFALGFSCFHVLVVNLELLPAPLRPGWFTRIGMSAAGTYFLLLSAVTLYFTLR